MHTLTDPKSHLQMPQVSIVGKANETQIRKPLHGMVLMGNPTYKHKMDTAASAHAASTLHNDRSLQATAMMMLFDTLHPGVVA